MELDHAEPLAVPLRRPVRCRYQGKKKARRLAKENDLLFLPSVDENSPLELSLQDPWPSTSFLNPPPARFQTKAYLKAKTRPTSDPLSTHCGRFRMGVKGLQRQLTTIIKSGNSRAYRSILVIEQELSSWLADSDVFFQGQARVIDDAWVESCNLPAITQVERQHQRLIWLAPEPFTRRLIHLIARLWEVVSFSKEDPASGHRMTYLYRPHVAHPNAQALKGGAARLATPPTTDFETSSFADSDVSDWTYSEFDPDETLTPEVQERLDSLATLHRVVSLTDAGDDADSEATEDLAEELADSVQSLSML